MTEELKPCHCQAYTIRMCQTQKRLTSRTHGVDLRDTLVVGVALAGALSWAAWLMMRLPF